MLRFWNKTRVSPMDGCIIWMASRDKDGYGRFQLDGRNHRAHRLAYFWERGEIPTGLQIDHLCRNRACVNPAHMEIVTAKENTLRGNTITAANAAKTHCSHGHEYTPENTRVYRGERDCRECRARINRDQYLRRMEAV